MKLTNEQIEYVENYIISKDIKWYELQVELTDHMVTSMEEFWEQNPDLSFEQVKENTFKKFTKPELKAIEKQRTNILGKEFRHSQWKMIKEYLQFPKIFATLILLFLSYNLLLYFTKPLRSIAILFGFLLVLYIPFIFNYFKNREIDGKRFLQIEQMSPIHVGLGFINLGLNGANLCKEWIEQYNIVRFIFCALWVLGILFLFTGNQIYKSNLATIKKQYQLT